MENTPVQLTTQATLIRGLVAIHKEEYFRDRSMYTLRVISITLLAVSILASVAIISAPGIVAAERFAYLFFTGCVLIGSVASLVMAQYSIRLHNRLYQGPKSTLAELNKANFDEVRFIRLKPEDELDPKILKKMKVEELSEYVQLVLHSSFKPEELIQYYNKIDPIKIPNELQRVLEALDNYSIVQDTRRSLKSKGRL